MPKVKERYVPSEKEQTFLDKVTNGKYDRQIITGLKKFIAGTVPEESKKMAATTLKQGVKNYAKFYYQVLRLMPICQSPIILEKLKSWLSRISRSQE